MTHISWLKKQENKVIKESLPILAEIALNEKAWWMRMTGINVLQDLEEMITGRIHVAEKELKEIKSGDDKELDIRNSIDDNNSIKKEIDDVFNDIKATEKNKRLRRVLGLKD